MLLVWFQTDDGHRLDSHNSCGESTPTPDPGPTPADIARAFRPDPAPRLRPHHPATRGATLVNFDTNFYTHATPFDRTITLLGHQVRFKITPTSYHWHFGDHTHTTTHTPGAAYPHLDITHRYQRHGTATPSVDTTWTADYQLDHHPWTPVQGTVTITGTPQQLTIKTATPTLVG